MHPSAKPEFDRLPLDWLAALEARDHRGKPRGKDRPGGILESFLGEVVLGRADAVDGSHLPEEGLDGFRAGNDRFRHESGTAYANHPSDFG